MVFLFLFLLTFFRQAEAEGNSVRPADAHIAVLTISGAIGPATKDYLIRAMTTAEQSGAVAVVIVMDTPGGLDSATRDIIKAVLSSSIPVITFVHPAGGRAASAGTYILYASHIAAMAPSTTLGAATPVSIGAPMLPSAPSSEKESDGAKQNDSDQNRPKTTMERKVVNDAVSYIRGLAKRHNRNEEWAEKAVRQAATLTAGEALEKHVIDVVAKDLDHLLAQIHLREVRVEAGKTIISSEGLDIVEYNPDWRNKLLAIITDPQIAYILLMMGIYGLVLEGYNPGALVPGVIGAICLLTAFYALQVLPVNYAGLALIVLGVILLVAETVAPSFGVLGIGGIAALTLGSIMLIDSDFPGMEISYGLVGGIAAVSATIVFLVLFEARKHLKMHRVPIDQALVGKTATVANFHKGRGVVRINGELWRAVSTSAPTEGKKVRIISQDGFSVNVEPIEENTS